MNIAQDFSVSLSSFISTKNNITYAVEDVPCDLKVHARTITEQIFSCYVIK